MEVFRISQNLSYLSEFRLSFDCVSKTVVLFAYLLIVLIMSFFHVRFSVKLFLND